MNGSNQHNSIARKVWLSSLAGLGSALFGFFAGTIVSGLLIIMFFNIFGTFTEVGPQLVLYGSPIIGLVTAFVMGIQSGIKAFNHRRESSDQ